jgi:Leucine Rich repeat
VQLSNFFNSIKLMPGKLPLLNTLVLSKVSMLGKSSAYSLSQAFEYLPKLKYLDISYNAMNSQELSTIIECLSLEDQVCKIRSLNISGNSAINNEPSHHGSIDKFSDRLQKYLKSSLFLQHLDLSAMCLSESQIHTIIIKGVKKAKSLLSIHLSGNEMTVEQIL